MKIIRDCDGTKHLHLDWLHVQVSNSGMRQGAFSKAFSRGFDIGGLYFTLHDGSKVSFDYVADKAVLFGFYLIKTNMIKQSSKRRIHCFFIILIAFWIAGCKSCNDNSNERSWSVYKADESSSRTVPKRIHQVQSWRSRYQSRVMNF